MVHGIDPKINDFIQGKFILLAKHPPGISEGDLAAQLADWLKAPENAGIRLAPPEPEAICSFPFSVPGDKVLSIIAAPLRNPTDPEVEALTVGFKERLASGPIEIGGGITLEAASPNWFLGGSPHQIGTGGPGGPPTPVVPPAAAGEGTFNLANVDLAKLTERPDEDDEGKGSIIAILDTAPSVADLSLELHEVTLSGHKLARDLLDPYPGRLTVYNASLNEMRSLAPYSLSGEGYLMSDHGIFVAGIISTIAPGAKLHLFEVLNPY